MKRVIRVDDWNDYAIRAKGRRIQIWVSGERAARAFVHEIAGDVAVYTGPASPMNKMIGAGFDGAGTASIEVLAETSPSVRFKQPHPAVWITTHPIARIVGIALGHDERVHDHQAFKTLLANAVK